MSPCLHYLGIISPQQLGSPPPVMQTLSFSHVVSFLAAGKRAKVPPKNVYVNKRAKSEQTPKSCLTNLTR